MRKARTRIRLFDLGTILMILWSGVGVCVADQDLQIETFAEVGGVEQHLATESGREKAAQIMRRMEITKIHLDLLRSGHLTDWDLVRDCHKFFTSQGFEVSAGITTSKGLGWGVLSPDGGCFCYTHEKTQADLEVLCSKAAELFDEIIVDDFFMTFCECPLCDRARASRTWEEYRSALMSHVGRTRIVRAAHAKNPRCRVTIKYPQWYDKFHEFGYNPEAEGEDFDMVWVGTETRDPETLRFGYVQQFEGFFNFSWIAGFHPEKTFGAWYDHGDITPEVFVEQGYQSVLAGARNLTLFHLGDLLDYGEVQEAFVRSLPVLRVLRDLCAERNLAGVYAYKPLGSRGNAGEFYIFDYLGMLGVPLVPCHTFPTQGGTVFLSSHALKDPDLIDKIQAHFKAGGSIVATPVLLEALAHEPEIRSRFGYKANPISRMKSRGNKLRVENEIFNTVSAIQVAHGLNPSPETAIPVKLVQDDYNEIPLFTESETPEGGRAMILNLSTFSQEDFDKVNERFLAPSPISFLDLHPEAASRIRLGIMHRRPIILDAPARMGAYFLNDDVVVLENFKDEPASIRVNLEGKWKERIHGSALDPAQAANEYNVTVPARDIIALERDGG
ncbi:MAG: hypothetical protein ABIH23_01005 [bacterium]